MLRQIKDYIIDNNFKIVFTDNNLNLINYTDIVTIEKDIILVKVVDKKIIIKGKNMVLKKLLDSEILIIGDINSIELEKSNV